MSKTPNILDFEFLGTVPNITMCMDYAGSCLYLFEDGTAAIFNDELPDFIYSPRLTIEELEAFCMVNLGRYEAFFEENAEQIECGEPVILEPWWN